MTTLCHRMFLMKMLLLMISFCSNARSQRPPMTQSGQRPEDFMDEEDMGAFGFAPQVLRASKKFSKEPDADVLRKRKLGQEESLLAHAVIINILPPSRETIGEHFDVIIEIKWRHQNLAGNASTNSSHSMALKFANTQEPYEAVILRHVILST